jgi:hypothetical protein
MGEPNEWLSERTPVSMRRPNKAGRSWLGHHERCPARDDSCVSWCVRESQGEGVNEGTNGAARDESDAVVHSGRRSFPGFFGSLR